MGDRVVIIGGGQVGCETALHLAGKGKRVSVLEMRRELAPDASITHRGELMAEIAAEVNFTALTEARCTGVTAEGVAYEHEGEIRMLPADTVILAAGMMPLTAEADSFAPIAPYHRPAGDCVAARTVEAATREGYFAGINV
jgi:pyruvate/2-oxoglutarate dehydrogenase complex dihydrolipoamide dehydrogenase (E3) component